MYNGGNCAVKTQLPEVMAADILEMFRSVQGHGFPVRIFCDGKIVKCYDHGSSCLAPIFQVFFLYHNIPGAVVGVIAIPTMIIDINSNGVIYDRANGYRCIAWPT